MTSSAAGAPVVRLGQGYLTRQVRSVRRSTCQVSRGSSYGRSAVTRSPSSFPAMGSPPRHRGAQPSTSIRTIGARSRTRYSMPIESAMRMNEKPHDDSLAWPVLRRFSCRCHRHTCPRHASRSTSRCDTNGRSRSFNCRAGGSSVIRWNSGGSSSGRHLRCATANIPSPDSPRSHSSRTRFIPVEMGPPTSTCRCLRKHDGWCIVYAASVELLTLCLMPNMFPPTQLPRGLPGSNILRGSLPVTQRDGRRSGDGRMRSS